MSSNKNIPTSIQYNIAGGICHQLNCLNLRVTDGDFPSSVYTKDDKEAAALCLKVRKEIKGFDGDHSDFSYDEFAFKKWQKIAQNKKFRATYSKFIGDMHTNNHLEELTEHFEQKLALKFMGLNNKMRVVKVKKTNQTKKKDTNTSSNGAPKKKKRVNKNKVVVDKALD